MFISFLIMIIVNYLANALPINGKTTGEISDQLNVLFTPAGYVFSIWGLIYLLLAIWLIISFFKRDTSEATTTKISYLFSLSCLLNAGWLLSFHYEKFILSSIIIIALLIVLILIYLSYPIGVNRFGGRLPFSFYLGWISVATIANISYTLQFHEISLGIDEVTGTILLIVVAAVIAIAGRYISNDPFFAIVFVWAIIGIAKANPGTTIETAAYTVAIVIFISIIFLPFLAKRRTSNKA